MRCPCGRNRIGAVFGDSGSLRPFGHTLALWQRAKAFATADGTGSFATNQLRVFEHPECHGGALRAMALTDYQPLTLGNVNMDGAINLLDIAPFVDAISNGTFTIEADINLDGVVNLLDVNLFVELLSN